MSIEKKRRAELRKDYVQEKYVIIAPRRTRRPGEVKAGAHGPLADDRVGCPFCPDSLDLEKELLTLGRGRKWRIKVTANRFPAVTPDNPRAFGRQEVIVETPDHGQHLEDLPDKRLVELLDVYARRTKELLRDRRLQYVLIFKNDGGPAGASLRHSHSQIFATNFIPPHLLDKSRKAFEYRLRQGSCVYCDVLAREARGPRRVYADRHVVAFTPYASMHNYELWILPRRHIDNVTELTAAEKASWAKVLRRALRAVVALGLPYNYYFHQVSRDVDQHLYMKITPRGTVWAGVEIGSGVIINPIAPEAAARYYRHAMR